MTLSAEELLSARESANAILEELGLDTYIFEVELQDDAHYELKVECACESDGGWASISFTIPREKMLAGFVDAEIKRYLFEYWDKKLLACKRKTGQGKGNEKKREMDKKITG